MSASVITSMKKSSKPQNYLPIFDNLPFIKQQTFQQAQYPDFGERDFVSTHAFLLSYRNNDATFKAYRRETERLLQWAWYIHQKSILKLKRIDIEAYIAFCQKPPLNWIGTKKVPRFLKKDGQRKPNLEWRPFIATIPKAQYHKGYSPNPKEYLLSGKSLREVFTVTSSLYQFLIREEYTDTNSVLHIRQKSHYFRIHQSKAKIRRLTTRQWEYVLETAQQLADQSQAHERTLFIISILYSLYLRISELSAIPRWVPTMGDFAQDSEGLWWFTTVGKNNKERQIAVSDDLLEALKRYRISLNLNPLPSPHEKIPLISKQHGKGPIKTTSRIRDIVQFCFNRAIKRLDQDKFTTEAESLRTATVHWLRHTGISDDIKHRPATHVRDDAGHSSSLITDRYVNIERDARHASSKNKRIYNKSSKIDAID